VGFAPINNPAVTVLVQLDSPVGAHEGGAVAAPAFRHVAEQVLAYRNIPHDIPLSTQTMRASAGPQNNAAAEDVADFNPVQMDSPDNNSDNNADNHPHNNPSNNPDNKINGAATSNRLARNTVASSALPAARSKTLMRAAVGDPPAAAALPTVELAEGTGMPVPGLAGKTVRQVMEICQQLGLNPVLIGSGIATEQVPEAGSSVRRGGTVTVYFGRTVEVATARLHVRKASK
jgi:PASTA domain